MTCAFALIEGATAVSCLWRSVHCNSSSCFRSVKGTVLCKQLTAVVLVPDVLSDTTLRITYCRGVLTVKGRPGLGRTKRWARLPRKAE